MANLVSAKLIASWRSVLVTEQRPTGVRSHRRSRRVTSSSDGISMAIASVSPVPILRDNSRSHPHQGCVVTMMHDNLWGRMGAANQFTIKWSWLSNQCWREIYYGSFQGSGSGHHSVYKVSFKNYFSPFVPLLRPSSAISVHIVSSCQSHLLDILLAFHSALGIP